MSYLQQLVWELNVYQGKLPVLAKYFTFFSELLSSLMEHSVRNFLMIAF